MHNIIKELFGALQKSNISDKEELKKYLHSELSAKERIYSCDYPVAVVNDARKDTFDGARNVDLVVLREEQKDLIFEAKRERDFWKRLLSVAHIEAMITIKSVNFLDCRDDFIEHSMQKNKNNQWSVETALRDAMRANKENRELGVKPFIVILTKEFDGETSTDHLALLLKHYFGENFQEFQSEDKKINYYLAYNEQMQDIGMRYFYKFTKSSLFAPS